jgi:hypothetical protein
LRSLDWARRQGALSWELRTSTSLARLQQDQGRTAEARSLLQRVYDRFSEGFETAVLKAAKAHLNSLQCDVPGAGGAHFLGAVYSDRASNLLMYLGAKSAVSSENPLKSLRNRADFDSTIRVFKSSD